ncbi:MAG: hypothetical protein AAFO87_07525 [Cyanobacteria bacterium J06607_6]
MNEAASSTLNALLTSDLLLVSDRPEPDPKSGWCPTAIAAVGQSLSRFKAASLAAVHSAGF